MLVLVYLFKGKKLLFHINFSQHQNCWFYVFIKKIFFFSSRCVNFYFHQENVRIGSQTRKEVAGSTSSRASDFSSERWNQDKLNQGRILYWYHGCSVTSVQVACSLRLCFTFFIFFHNQIASFFLDFLSLSFWVASLSRHKQFFLSAEAQTVFGGLKNLILTWCL